MFRFLADGEVESASLDYGALDEAARAIAHRLGRAGARDERVLLLYPSGLDFVAAFFGCLYAGAVAVPAYPPRGHRDDPRLRAIVDDARPRFALGPGPGPGQASGVAALEGVEWLSAGSLPAAVAEGKGLPVEGAGPSPDDIAFLQYTSGSTSTPKGVVVRHGNLLHNEGLIHAAFGQSEESVVVGWLPLYHDMGLIGNVLQTVYAGAECVLMAPAAFLQSPVRWLRAIDRYRATTSGGPDFAYDLAARKVADDEVESLDLSSWTVAFDGAEPVRSETLTRFAERFAPAGFRRRAFLPCYGLAEATLFVSGARPGEGAPVRRIDPEALAGDRWREVPGTSDGVPGTSGEGREIVGAGVPSAEQRVEIVDPESLEPLPAGRVGEIWVAGPSVAGGYWGRPEATARDFEARVAGREDEGPWLRTGDLGCLVDGELFVTGRLKDLIIVRGRNVYPQDVERTAAAVHEGLPVGGGAAFGVDFPARTGGGSEERLVVVHEVERTWRRKMGGVPAEVARAIAAEHQAPIEAVVLVRPGGVPKTTSGKVQRRATRAAWERGELAVVAEWRRGGGGVGAMAEEGAAAGAPAGPGTPVEERLAEIVREVFEVERVAMDEGFFELGGDSLKAAQLGARIGEAFGIELPLEALFDAPDLRALAATVETVQGAGAGRDLPPIEPSSPAERAAGAPLSFAQRRLWFLHRLDPTNPVHNIAAEIALAGRPDVPALARAFSGLVERQEALRTGFREGEGREPEQVVLPAPRAADGVAAGLPVIELSALPAPAGAREAARLAREIARLPFDLGTGARRPALVRPVLVRLAPDRHRLVVALHHAASDGASLGVLIGEIEALYTGGPEALAQLPVQYADFARWQRASLRGDALERRLAWWRSLLADRPAATELPADRVRPPVLSHRGEHLERPLPAALAARVEALARRSGATPFMVLLAGFLALLHRHAGRDSLVVGTPIAGRVRPELDGLIGAFINNLVIRLDAGGDPGFEAFLQRVRRASLDAFAHQEAPFEALVEELAPERDLSRTPLVQILFVGQNAPLGRRRLADLELVPREIDAGTARFDLALSVAPLGDGWLGTWKLSADLFDRTTIARLADRWERLLAGATEYPERPLSALALSARTERHQLLHEWNDTRRERPGGPLTLREMLARQREATPDAAAVVEAESGAVLTYRGLHDRARALARRLRSAGVGPESRVALAVERSLELMIAVVGVIEAGASYLPLDPDYPRERLAFMLEDSSAAVLLVGPDGPGAITTDGPVLVVDRNEVPGTSEGTSDGVPVTSEIGPRHAAYTIYTSGSTGRPKGVVVSHGAIVNRILWMQEEYGLDGSDRVLQKTPVSFDVSVWELFWPLVTGAALVLAPPGSHREPARLAEVVRDRRVTTLHFVPSMLAPFLGTLGVEEATAGVRRVISSGEALPADLAERFRRRIGERSGAGLHNLYGPTEAAVDVTFHACGRDDEAGVPIGRPIANLVIHLADVHMGPAPLGVPGELLIAGAGLARGYHGLPGLTAERFVPDPAAAADGEPGARVYRTGDLARYRTDGSVEYLGRLDHQVKVRGFRVELGEVESALAGLPGVAAAVVVARTEAGRTRLIAYVAAAGGDAQVTPESLRSGVASTLPEAMIPSAFVVLAALPLTPSGKVDRKALPDPVESPSEVPGTSGGVGRTEPRDRLEARLAALWGELLGTGPPGVHDDFFALGGDSIQAAMLANRLQRELGETVYVMTLFEAPTVAALAAALREGYPESAARLAGEAVEEGSGAGGTGPEAPIPTPPAVTEQPASLGRLREAVARRLGLPPSGFPGAGADPGRPPLARPVLFILSPFRSGSTLLRVMLEGHPGLFAPPELELLAFPSLGARREAYSGRDAFAREGLLRAVMELRGLDADGARELVAALEEEDLSTAGAYARLQEWAGDRLLVDKTPSYALDRRTLARAEELFEAPLYLHLVRHPQATVASYVEARMDRVYAEFPFPAREQAELIWRLAHENALAHLAGVPAERKATLRFEDLVARPRAAMERVVALLGLPFDEAVLDPYGGGRMTDGLHTGTRMMGDPKFHRHGKIEAKAADRWKEEETAPLGRPTRELASALGYPDADPLSYAQERLWVLTRLEPASSAYNMPAAVRLDGDLDVPALARALTGVLARHEVLRTGFPEVAGEPAPRPIPVEEAVAASGATVLPTVDLSRLPEAVAGREVERLAVAEGARAFDLERAPMLRATLLRLGASGTGSDRASHVLLATMHHVASDGWSIGILIRELAALYGAFSRGEPSPLVPLPIQYGDYARWQRRRLSGERLREHLDHWRERLSGRLPALELPTDRPRPAVQTFEGARVSTRLPLAETAAVRAWSRERGTTFFVTLLAAFDALLQRYTGQDDVLLGIPTANRTRLEVEGLIGFFLNMVVERADLSGDPTFGELVARVEAGFQGSSAHQEVPFEKVVEAVQPVRDVSRSPIFQIQFSLQNTPPAALELPGLTLELLEIHNGTTKFDLTVFLFDEPEGLRTTLEYNRDLFDRSTMARFLGHWSTLLSGAVAAPGTRLSRLPLLTAAERSQLRTEWNDPAARFLPAPAEDRFRPLHLRFLDRAAERPDDPAVVHGVEELTYRELADRSGRLARRLRELGVGPESRVALGLDRSLELVVAILGVLRAGGAYVPLDPDYPEDRLRFTLEDAFAGQDAPVLVTRERLRERFAPSDEAGAAGDGGAGWSTVVLDGPEGPDGGALDDLEPLPAEPVAPEALAYVIYTSGSTGRPKGVGISHAAAARLFDATDPWFGFGPDDVWTLFHSYAFDFSVWELWGALAHGGLLVVVPQEVARSPEAFHQLLATEGVTVLNQTPSAFRQLVRVDEELAAAGGGRRLALREVVFGGEALDLAALAPWVARHGDRSPRLVNMYGITETTVHVTYRPVTADDVARPGVSPVGVPIPDLSVHLGGARGEEVPIGAAGEMLVGGDGLARGYLGRPGLTAARFMPDAYSSRPGARLYRSGDLARRRPDGDLEYLGRLDHQVKVRGFRIELGEIESALSAHPAVAEAVVLASGDRGDDDRKLIAYLVARGGDTGLPGADELRRHLGRALPEYMVPGVFVPLAALPISPTGKVDRRALPDPEEAGAGRLGPRLGLAGTDGPVAPRNPLERRLAEAFAEVLGVEEVGVHDDFFDLGGHSLLATRLVTRVRAAFGIELAMAALFEAPSVADLAVRVAELAPAGDEGAGDAAPIGRVPRGPDAELPLSFSQERLWFLDRLDPGSPLYNVPAAFRMRGTLDAPAFTRALNRIVGRHEALRTGFGEVDGRPVQRVAEGVRLAVPVVDLSRLPRGARDGELARLAAEEAQAPFDLARPPLFRVRLVRLGTEIGGAGEAEHAVLATLHHVIADGWSVGVLVRELAVLYRAFVEGRRPPLPELPPLPIQYGDFAAWQREHRTDEALAGDLDFWRRELDGASFALDLPADRPRPPVQGFRGRHLPVALTPRLADELRELAREEGATLFMVLLTGFQALLARWAGRDDLLVGSPVANRERVETEGLIGFFVNTLVLRGKLSGAPTGRQAIARARASALAAFEHASLPFERLVEAVAPERDTSRAPLVQAMFVLQNAYMGTFGGALDERRDLPGLTLEPLPLESGTAQLDLSLYLVDSEEQGGDGSLGGFLELATDLFDRTTGLRLLGHYRALLEGMAADPDAALAALPLLGAGERQQLLAEWTDAPGTPRPFVAVHRRIAGRAAEEPDRVALESGGVTLSHGELRRRVRRLASGIAGGLAEAGARSGEEPRVAIALDRGVDLVTAVLAVLEAGAVYVPLDPSQPEERRERIAEQAEPALTVDAATVRRLVEAGSPAGSDAPPAPPDLIGDPEGMAYVLFTSGSTGLPKGVGVSHGALANFLDSMARAPGITSSDTWVAVTTLSFDIAGLELFLPLLSGARLVVATRGEVEDGARLAGLMERSRATVHQATPAGWRMLLDSAPPAVSEVTGTSVSEVTGTSGRGVFRGLRALSGGEALMADLARDLVAEGVAELWNVYGPTETTVWSAARRVTAAEVAGDEPRSAVTVGGAVDRTRLAVVDPALRPVPIGVPGELVIGGAGLARGYLGAPAQTAGAFLPDAFAAGWGGAPGARLYRTGDRARFLPDGRIELLGRLDHQLKVRGFRIEPGEVESALLSHPAVARAVVVGHGEGESRRLVAYLVAEEGTALPGHDALRQHLAGRLPEYMLPSLVVPLDALPLGPSGKVDRKALPAPETALAGAGDEAPVPPRDPVEAGVAAIWCDLLGIDPGAGGLSVHRSFFELGGHSLLATRLMARLRRDFGVELPVRRLFELPTVARLSAAVKEARRDPEVGEGTDVGPATIPALPRDPSEPAPLSFSQERLWFLDRLAPGDPLYDLPVTYRLRGALDVPRLAGALAAVVRRHAALRARFEATDHGPVQRFRPPEEVEERLPLIDLAALPERPGESAMRAAARLSVRRRFDLATGPLHDFRLLRLAADDHALVGAIHHVAADGWSLGLLVREVGEIYAAGAQASTPHPLEARAPDLGAGLPEPAIEYADFAAWQRERLDGPDRSIVDDLVGWWRETLDGAPRVLDLPADRPRPPVRSGRGRHERVALSAAATERVDARARALGATPFMLLLSAWYGALSTLSGRDDLLVATPVAGRELPELEAVVGVFINTLVLRGRLGEAATGDALVSGTRERTLDALARQELPFERLVDELAPERDRARPPLAQVLFAYQDAPARGFELPGLALEPFAVETGIARFDVSLSLEREDAGLGGALEVDADLFDATTARRMIALWRRWVDALGEAPERPLAVIAADAALSLPERQQTVVEANDAPRRAPFEAVHRAVLRRAGEQPDAVALVWADETVSYGELGRRVRAGAAELRRRLAAPDADGSAGPEPRVAITLPRSTAMLVAVLATLEAGAAYVPVDPDHPEDRRAAILEDAAPALVVDGPLPSEVPGTSGNEVPGTSGGRSVEPGRLAYVLFTSGSTGRPKGVAVAHGALASFLASMAAAPGLGPDDALAAVTTLSFDIAGLELFLPLVRGGRVELVAADEAADGARLADRLARSRATVMQATPATWRLLLDQPEPAWRDLSLRRALSGGEALPADLAAGVLDRLASGGAEGELWNLYGPTETTVWSATTRVSPQLPDGPVELGRPIAATRIFVLDRRLRPVPPGVPGELAIGGAGVARGYLGRPALTAALFVPDPFAGAGDPGGRLYRTGDLVRRRPSTEGSARDRLEYLGRLDHQVKIRGFRIELGEIEAALASHPAVARAVVAARGEGADRRLVAWVSRLGEECDDLPAALRHHLAERLPAYMVPAAIAAVDAFPLTPSGKIDRGALLAVGNDPEVARGPAAGAAGYRDPVEETVAGLVGELLGVERPRADESFFDLGGHSLLATRLVSRLRGAMGAELAVSELFAAPTVAGIAEAARRARRRARDGAAPGAGGVPPLRPRDAREEGSDPARAPLSYAQERLWFIERLDPTSSLYNIPVAVRLTGDLAPPATAALAGAFAGVVRRHEALRTAFRDDAGEPYQVVLPYRRPPFPVADLSGLPEARARAEAQRLASGETHRAFDLAAGSPARAGLVRVRDDEAVLLVSMHHLVSDGWSMGVFLGEMAELYTARLGGADPGPELPPLPVQYADFAAWQRGWLTGPVMDREVAWWTARLADVPPLVIPGDAPRAPGTRGHRAATAARELPFELPAELTAAIESLARRRGATPFMVVVAAFGALLGRLAGRETVVVGTPVANRDRAEIEGLIGFFVNTLALRIELDGDPSFDQLLERARESILGAFDHRDLPFARLVEALAPDRRSASSPVVRAMVTLHNQPLPEPDLPGLRMERLAGGEEDDLRTNFALGLRLRRDGERLTGGFGYDAESFLPETVAGWRDALVAFLEEVTAEPDRRLAESRALPEPPAAGPEAPVDELPLELERLRRGLSDRKRELSERKRELLRRKLEGVAGRRPSAGAPREPRPAAAGERTAAPVVLRPAFNGHGSGLALVHAIGGTVFGYRQLVQAMDAGPEVLGLQAPGLDGREAPLDRVEELAELHAATLRRRWPDGPYLLAGWSFGGVVAYETARRLRDAGAEVAMLALLDARLPRPGDEPPDLSSWEERANGEPASAEARRARALLEVNRAGLRALHAYRPEPYGGPALIFRPSEARDGVQPPADAAEWAGLIAGPVTVIRISGDHRTMLKSPAVETIASTLAREMAGVLRPTEVKW